MTRARRLGARGRSSLAGAAALLVALSVLGDGATASAGTSANLDGRFRAAPQGAAITHKPLGLTNAPMTVVVQLAGDPVTVADADAATPLTTAQKTSRRNQLKELQAPAADRIRSLGGTVLGSYQSAYNGIKVRIAGNKTGELLDIPNVVAVHRSQTFTPDNVHGVPVIGAPAVWDGLNGYHGEGVKIAVIDTGIDYTHADFGGPGTTAAYDAAHAVETAPADPALFGPNAPKVKGGVDLVGDSYNADPASDGYQPVPHPDANPLDCNGHGTHVAGTATGLGVLADGTTYRGAYDDSTISSHDWLVGPGVAPKADLYSVRVFGCEGSTDVVVDAIEWAVDHDMDVINMSLGSPWGSADSPDAVAADNAAKDGVIVVTSAGNSGPSPYMVGSPSTASNTISVAASDPTAAYPGAALALSTGTALTAIDANGAALPAGALPVVVLKTGANISLGCDVNEYKAANVTGKIVVVQRGTCARVARAVFGQQAGAAAVVMVNNAAELPPYEGPITGNPDTGEQYGVSIPLLGVSKNDAAALLAADGGSVTLSAQTIPNPGYLATASFSSGGARTGDSALKPDVTAPGVSIFSAGVGTGNGFVVESGTSMAAPHTTGMAALVRQAHPNWRKVAYWKAAIVNTADPAKVNGYETRTNGAGLIQAPGATQTQVVATGDKGTATLSYGFAELDKDYTATKTITLRNFDSKPVTFTASTTLDAGSPHSVSLSSTKVTVPAKGTKDVTVRLRVPAATAGTSAAYNEVAGLVTFTPAAGANRGVALKVPYYLVPQTISKVSTSLDGKQLAKTGSAVATVTNKGGATSGLADFYALGLVDRKDKGLGANDVRAVGVQALPGALGIAISTEKRWSNPAAHEFDVYIDVDRDGTDDYDVVSTDYGLMTAGDPDGQAATFVFNMHTGAGAVKYLTDAPFDASTMVLPVEIAQLCTTGAPCLSAANPRFAYHVESLDLLDSSLSDVVDGTATFNAFTPSISTGMTDVVAPGATARETVTISSSEWAATPALGVLVISHDNAAADEAQIISVK
ncbi:S8 family peptidase [Hamadaea tsunoensis]|uniref:S8 family peptidase n=1 Tax=Hamadaea tsunoensis TaxID=53368 RepID=UPI00040FC92E|nr:S8 family serine peptidase [Hamadaea tsunoensis]